MAWLCRVYAQGWDKVQGQGRDHAILSEDFARLKEYLEDFDKQKIKLPVAQRDINRLSFADLKEIVIAGNGGNEVFVADLIDQIPGDICDETTILYEGPAGHMVIPHSTKAAIFWSHGTEWCTGSTKANNEFQSYNEDGPTIIMFPAVAKGKRYQTNITSSLMDQNNVEQEWGAPEDLLPVLNAVPGPVKKFLARNSGTTLYPRVVKKGEFGYRKAIDRQGDWEDKAFVLQRVREWGLDLKYASDDLKADPEVILAAIENHDGAMREAPSDFRFSRDFMIEAAEKNIYVLGWDKSGLISEREYFLSKAKEDYRILQLMDKTLQGDQQIEHTAVEADIRALGEIPKQNWNNISIDTKQAGFRKALERDWRAIAWLHDVDLTLSPQDEQLIFKRGVADENNPLTINHLHLFPSLRNKNGFVSMKLDKAEKVLESLVNPVARKRKASELVPA